MPASSSTYRVKLERKHDFEDARGNISYSKRKDEIIKVTIDWTNELDTANSETVSSAAYTDSGVTRSSVSVSSPNTICSVTGIGYFDVTVTTSTSRKLKKRICFYSIDDAKESDY